MSYSVIALPRFFKDLKKLSKKYSSIKKDMAVLLDSLKKVPDQGTPLGKNCYKIRLAITSKGKGKSGGARIITYIQISGSTVFLLSIYDKTDKVNLTKKELEELLESIPE